MFSSLPRPEIPLELTTTLGFGAVHVETPVCGLPSESPLCRDGLRMLRQVEPSLTLLSKIEVHAKTHGRHVALRTKHRGTWQSATWNEVAQQAHAFALGLQPHLGDNPARLALCGPLSYPLLTALLAASLLQMEVVWIDAGLTPHALQCRLQAEGLHLFIAQGDAASRLIAEALAHQAQLGRLPSLMIVADALLPSSPALTRQTFADVLAEGTRIRRSVTLTTLTRQASSASERVHSWSAQPEPVHVQAMRLGAYEPPRESSSARFLRRIQGLGRRPSLLLYGWLAGRELQAGLDRWLTDGSLLLLAEPEQDIVDVLRETHPVYVIAPTLSLASLTAAWEARLPDPNHWQRRWLERSFRAACGQPLARSVVRRWLDRLIFLLPLRRQYGLFGFELAMLQAGELALDHHLLLRALGLDWHVDGRLSSRPLNRATPTNDALDHVVAALTLAPELNQPASPTG